MCAEVILASHLIIDSPRTMAVIRNVYREVELTDKGIACVLLMGDTIIRDNGLSKMTLGLIF